MRESSGQTAFADEELLQLATLTLQSAQFRVDHTIRDNFTYIVGTNDQSVLVVGAATSVEGLLAVEGALAEVAGGISIEEKDKDRYLFLITAQPVQQSQSSLLFGIVYNLVRVRRIVRASVEPTLAGVARALRPALPLTIASTPPKHSDPLSDLLSRLTEEGVALETIDHAVASFEIASSGLPVETHSEGYDDEA